MASWFDELDLGETTAAGMMTNKWVCLKMATPK